MKKIVLFTTFQPNSGGSGTILRSLLPGIASVEVVWLYPGYKASNDRTFTMPPISRSSFSSDLSRWVLNHDAELDRVADLLATVECDGYWLVLHQEGLLVFERLQRRSNKPIHVSVHDDTPWGMFWRSRRWKHLAPFADRSMKRCLLGASSVDTISETMRDYYRSKWGVNSTVIHRFIEETAAVQPGATACVALQAGSTLRIGHMGNLYSAREFSAFLAAVKRTLTINSLAGVVITLIGTKLDPSTFPERIVPDYIEHLDEAAAIEKLASSDILYCMYPFSTFSKVFRRTSLPTKLGSYLSTGRPIFCHTPADSSLASVAQQFHIGAVCSSVDTIELASAITAALSPGQPDLQHPAALHQLFGYENVSRINRALGALVSTDI